MLLHLLCSRLRLLLSERWALMFGWAWVTGLLAPILNSLREGHHPECRVKVHNRKVLKLSQDSHLASFRCASLHKNRDGV
jgi:hypothetical protein